jgi:hypothetical protein
MPLTNTLETARRMEALGFTHQQAQGFAELLEDTANAPQQDLKDFIRGELGSLEGRLRSEFREELRKQMLWFFSLLTGLLGLAVAIIKLFPNAH